ncbi:MAG: UDP-N-acetylmuramoyl-L-alanyl-D-glutamate--2,6-diaminopimelate ligase, partial [Alphaproteobacteria bacterium]|nr:UDP-N-acetylmuramoyl-L-alanyl-D-glutamate--2,6-diaminopimelate ligase [Alphaproteobacteria bacterium]
REIARACGRQAASLGTLGLVTDRGREEGGMTTPDPVALHATLAALATKGTDFLAMEASSHGLDQYRLDGVEIGAAAFTNITRDHLDYHANFDAYFRAKLRLFTEVMHGGRVAVLNADLPEFPRLVAACRDRSHRVLRFGTGPGHELRLIGRRLLDDGQVLELEILGRHRQVELRLIGEFQAMNVLAALGLALAAGLDTDRAVNGLAHLTGVPGRVQTIGRTPRGGTVVVDYAHTPDALANVLAALRPHAEGRLVALFGCGGDRDRGKRPLMGQIAAERADLVFVTDDNPRSETPAAIRREILAACPRAVEIGDRRAAIRAAITGLEAGDLLVIAGKGHEQGQIVGATVRPFDDAVEAKAAITALKGGKP